MQIPMKILAVRFLNLNSLRGWTEIRLDREPFSGDGLFAITGPTGAGKSTIPDAICMALYGITPRLPKGGETIQQIMTKHTSECWSEVEFESDGQKYLSRYELRRPRSRNGGEGRVQSKMTLSNWRCSDPAAAGEWWPIAEKLRETQEAIVRLTGLDSVRFRQSVLLAQGEFASFLKSDASARADLLEKLTGTDIYRRLSIYAYERLRAIRTEHERITATLDVIHPPSEAEIESLRERLVQLEAERRLVDLSLESARQRRDAMNRFRAATCRRDKDAVSQERAKSAQLAMAVDRERLRLATLAGQFAGPRSDLAAMRQTYEKMLRKSRELESEQMTLVANLELLSQQCEESAAAWSTWINEYEKKCAMLDVTVDKERTRDVLQAQLDDSRGRRNDKKNSLNQAIRERESEHNKLAKLWETLELPHISFVQNTTDENSLELLRQFLTLARYRRMLADGAPCPLCGSHEHPYEMDHSDFPDDAACEEIAEKIRTVEEIRRRLNTLDVSIHEQEKRLKMCEDSVVTLEPQLAEIVRLISEEIGNFPSVAAARKSHEMQKQQLQRDISASESKYKSTSAVLETRRTDWSDVQHDIKAQASSIALAEQSLTNAVLEAGFADMTDFESAIRSPDEIRSLSRKCASADEELLRCGTRFQESEKEFSFATEMLSSMKISIPTTCSPEDFVIMKIESDVVDTHRKRDEIVSFYGELRQQLATGVELRRRWNASAAELTEVHRKRERAGRLSELIGSANGDKFGKFAQHLTFQELIYLANRRLAELSPRYRLRLCTSAELDFEIEDRDQAGVRRPPATLSGGETFLVSLSLALALSELAGSRTSPETLFLDEGFGTLDPATLDIVLDLLERIRLSGRTIGVISHVETLCERISTQIRVEPCGGGISRVRVMTADERRGGK